MKVSRTWTEFNERETGEHVRSTWMSLKDSARERCRRECSQGGPFPKPPMKMKSVIIGICYLALSNWNLATLSI